MTDHDFLFQIGLTVRKYRTVIGISQEELSARIDCDKIPSAGLREENRM